MTSLPAPSAQRTASPLIDQSLALDVYLRSLLSETAPADVPLNVAVVPAPAAVEVTPAQVEMPFQALLFRVAGLTLAVPLAELHGVLTWSATSITPLPGHAPFFLGVRAHLGRNVKIIDAGYLISPKGRRMGVTDPRHIVLIGGGEWGLACESIGEVIALAAKDIRWRSVHTERPWLLGTVTKHLCALLDTRAFAAELATGLPPV